jgi:hypothetical protein
MYIGLSKHWLFRDTFADHALDPGHGGTSPADEIR